MLSSSPWGLHGVWQLPGGGWGFHRRQKVVLAHQDQQLFRDATHRNPLDAKDTAGGSLGSRTPHHLCAIPGPHRQLEHTMSDECERGASWSDIRTVVMGGGCDAGAGGHEGRVRECRVWVDLGARRYSLCTPTDVLVFCGNRTGLILSKLQLVREYVQDLYPFLRKLHRHRVQYPEGF